MTPSNFPARSIGGLAIAIGGVTLIGIVSISLFYVVGGFFGPLNDLCNAVEAVLGAVLAWRLYPCYRSQSPRLSQFALIAALVGALVAVIGSALVIFRVTGWYLAGLYTMLGYALIGVWLFGFNASVLRNFSWPRRLVQLGRGTGAVMVAGLLSSAGIPGGVDSVGAAPWWVNVGFVGSLGWFLLYPIWCLWLGRLLLWHSVTMPVATHG